MNKKLLALSLLLGACFIFFVSGSVKAADYYVDSINGSDENSGKTVSDAWQSLDKINKMTFEPGDNIYLNSDSTWNGQLAPKGNGTQDNPIKIDRYGDVNKKPIINGKGTDNLARNSGTVMLINQHDWTIRNLEVTNYSDVIKSQRSGILILNTGEKILNNITIENNYVHDVNSLTQVEGAWKVSGGIILIGINEELNGSQNDNTQMGFNNVDVENNTVKNVSTAGIRNKTTKLNGSSESYPKLNTNITYKNNEIDNVFGDGLIISEIKDQGLVEGNKITRFCNANTNYNYAGLWVMSSDNVLVQKNEVADGLFGGNDGTAFDIDLYCNNVTYQYNYSHDNARGTVLFMNGSKNGKYRYNVSVNDGYDNNKMIFYLPTSQSEQVDIYNNLFITGKTTKELIRANDSKRAMHFYNNLVLSQNLNLKTFSRDDMSGDLLLNNNAIAGYKDDKYFGNNSNQEIQLDTGLQKLITNLSENEDGIDGLDFSELKNYQVLSKAGQPIDENIIDFIGNPVDKLAPTIGAIEI